MVILPYLLTICFISCKPLEDLDLNYSECSLFEEFSFDKANKTQDVLVSLRKITCREYKSKSKYFKKTAEALEITNEHD